MITVALVFPTDARVFLARGWLIVYRIDARALGSVSRGAWSTY